MDSFWSIFLLRDSENDLLASSNESYVILLRNHFSFLWDWQIFSYFK